MRETHIKGHFEISRKALHQDSVFFLITEPHYLHLKLNKEHVIKELQENQVAAMSTHCSEYLAKKFATGCNGPKLQQPLLLSFLFFFFFSLPV